MVDLHSLVENQVQIWCHNNLGPNRIRTVAQFVLFAFFFHLEAVGEFVTSAKGKGLPFWFI
jgi:hypothetical protein